MRHQLETVLYILGFAGLILLIVIGVLLSYVRELQRKQKEEYEARKQRGEEKR
jgi:glucose uptake protein GlcU